MHTRFAIYPVLALLATTVLANVADSKEFDPAEFASPSIEYRPRTWFHMQNGNVSKAGMTKDLEAIAEAGLGGVTFFHIDGGFPEGKQPFYSPEYMDTLAHGVRLGEQHGLAMGMHNCDGWSSAGGPWVSAEESMKKISWSETIVSGGRLDLETLSQPTTFRGFYRDIAIVAIPASTDQIRLEQTPSRYTYSRTGGEPTALSDQDGENEFTVLPSPHDNASWIRVDYEQAVTIRSLHLESYSRNGQARLELSSDGETFRDFMPLPKYRGGKNWWTFSAAFPAQATKSLRVELTHTTQVRKFEIGSEARLDNWIIQNGIATDSYPDRHWRSQAIDNSDQPNPNDAPTPLSSVKILHLGENLDPSTRVSLPPGNWSVFRFGYTSTGQVNARGSRTGLGLECDKLDPDAIESHFNAYLDKVLDQSRDGDKQTLRFALMDSYEMGGQNWTHGFEKTFNATQGYDIIPFLPAFTGRIIGSTAETKAVLSDLRTLVSQMMVKNYYQRFTELCHQRGLESYIEGYGIGTFNELAASGAADIPMGEFWQAKDGYKDHFNPVAISGAHIYGRKVISAEAFTSDSEYNWKSHPFSMKRYGDRAWTQGINEFMFHRFAHQANTHVKPGMTMGRFGAHIDRTQTWWNNAGKAWFDYIARGSYLLRQGNPVSDILVLLGDEEPSRPPKMDDLAIPEGYKADFCNIEVLTDRLTVEDGLLILPEGTAYRLLWLHNTELLRQRTLNRIEELVELGATVVGLPPQRPIGYLETKNGSDAFRDSVHRIWGTGTAPRLIGSGTLYPSGDLAKAIEQIRLEPDALLEGNPTSQFAHRSGSTGEVYFVFNQTDTTAPHPYSFRVSGFKPEIWDADTGAISTEVPYRITGGRTEITLDIEPYGSRFIVFRKPTSEKEASPPALPSYSTQLVKGPWEVAFAHDWGGSEHATFPSLADWSKNDDEGIRYYSGSAIYRNEFTLTQDQIVPNRPIQIDLGQVEISAVVSVNGQTFPTLWKTPFSIDIASACKEGANQLTIEVTNLWSNRLIGDERLPRTDGFQTKDSSIPMVAWYAENQPMPPSKRYTFTTYNFYEKDHTLLPSGLLGPVTLIFEK